MANSTPDNDSLWTSWGNSTCIDWHTSQPYIWPYCPSLEAAVIFATLFGIATIVHLVQAIRTRKRFCWVIVMAASWETLGFAIRAVSTRFQSSLRIYVPQQLLILLAPLWINAYVYMVYGRLVLFFLHDQKILGIRAEVIARYFVLLDILSFFVQCGGAILLSNTNPSSVKTGIDIYEAGLVLQQVFLAIFFGLLVLFHRRVQRQRSLEYNSAAGWRWLVRLEYAAVFLITVRITFRLVEFSNGFTSPVAHLESIFYIFDAVPMWLVITLFSAYHPSRTLVGPGSEFPSKRINRRRREIGNETSDQGRSWEMIPEGAVRD